MSFASYVSFVVVPPGARRRSGDVPGLSKQGRLEAVQIGQCLAESECSRIVHGSSNVVKETVEILADCCVLEAVSDDRLTAPIEPEPFAALLSAFADAYQGGSAVSVAVCVCDDEVWRSLAASRIALDRASVRFLNAAGWFD